MNARENFLHLERGVNASHVSDAELLPNRPVGHDSAEWPSPRAGESPHHAARTLMVLVVDDSAFNRRIMHDALYHRGHEVFLASTGRQAVQAWEKHSPDAILMDLQMPEMGGLEATARIRAAEDEVYPRRRVPIIAVTQNHTAPDRMSAIAAGVDDFLAKPTTAAAVIEAVERLAPQPAGGVDQPASGSSRSAQINESSA